MAITDFELAQIRGMMQQGKSQAEIARALDRSPSTVSRAVKIIEANRASEQEPIKPVAGKVSRNRATSAKYMGFTAPIPARDGSSLYQLYNLIDDWSHLLDPNDALLVLARHSPEVASAWHDSVMLAVGGWEANAYHADDPEKEHEEAQAELKSIMNRLGDRHGSFHALAAEMVTSIVFRGALGAESVYGKDRQTLLDIAVIDPSWIMFRPVHDEELGDHWELGQMQDGKWVSLEIPTIRYMPYNRIPKEPPYGVPMFQPSVMPAVFMLGLLYDIRRVMAKQGFGRLDVTIITEQLVTRMAPDRTKMDGDKIKAMIETFAAEISDAMEELLPDDVFVHTDDVEVNHSPNGGGEGNMLNGIASLIESLERQLIKALKSMPLLQAVTDGVSEANANKQWEIYAKTIGTLQQMIENMLGYHLRYALRLKGYDVKVELRFAEVRGIDEYREAEAFSMKVEGAVAAENAKYMTPEEAAMYVTGHGIPDIYADELENGRSEPMGDTSTSGATTANPDRLGEHVERIIGYIAGSLPGSESRAEPMSVNADDSLTPIPPGRVSNTDIEASERFWDMHVPAAAGILSAPVVED